MPTSEGIDTWSGTLHIAHQDLSRVASSDTAFEVDIKATPFGLSILAMELRKPAMSYTCSITLRATMASND
jgi:hypothetical protein